MKLILCRLTAVVLLTLALVSDCRADKVDDYIQTEMSKRRIPGLALGVVRNGELVRSQAYGTANLETDSPVKPESVFDLASLTKPFTATAVMILAEEGKLNIDESVRKYVEGLPESWEDMTIAHLLSHTSGLPALFPEEETWPPLLDNSTARMFASLVKLRLTAPPGTRERYSDPGYFLLGMVIEKVSGQRWGDFLSARIFQPLNMNSTLVLNHWTIVRNLVSPYTLRAGRLLNARRDFQDELPSFYGLRSTIADLAKWDRALREGTLLKKETLARMWTPARLRDGQEIRIFDRPYGLGWMLGEVEEHPIAEHGGFTGTHMLRLLDNGLTVIVLTNLDVRSGSQPASLARGVVGLLSH